MGGRLDCRVQADGVTQEDGGADGEVVVEKERLGYVKPFGS